ncbi:sulfite exporter TauE/SafE family protein [Maricaulis sp.]|uniref:sulfite exporter TauE/SafE family protein n=1 Tax=Maricaulis sp. TaxID=1486257 RepID=UPI003A8CB9C3
MDALTQLSLAGGVLAGFASSLHCVGMCGGIASGLMLTLAPDGDHATRARVILLAQLGRVGAYVVAGAIVGLIGSSVYFSFDRGVAHALLRWAGAVTLVYIGLSVAGWAPSLAGLDRVGNRVVTWLRAPLGSAFSAASPVLAGFVWGFLPCGMVYAALFYAMMSGSAAGGAAIMAGFGLGTVPAIIGAAFGAQMLLRLSQRPGLRRAVGLAIVALGLASAAIPWRTLAAMCGIELG